MTKTNSMIFILTMITFLAGGAYAAGRLIDGRQGYLPSAAITGEAPGLECQVLAANEQSPDKSQTDSESGEKATEAAEEKKDPSQTATKPLKPFVPSEKVKAGQVVDFPYDI